MSRARKRVLIGTRTAPILCTANARENPGVAVVEPERHVIAVADTRHDQALGRIIDALRDLPECVTRLLEYQPLGIGQAGGHLVRQVSEPAFRIPVHLPSSLRGADPAAEGLC